MSLILSDVIKSVGLINDQRELALAARKDYWSSSAPVKQLVNII